MAKLSLTDLASLTNESSAIATFNANWALIEQAVENTLSLDGTSPNSMSAIIDMNSHKIINCSEPTSSSDVATKNYVDSNLTGADGADGADGGDGWSPLLAVVEDGTRRVLQIIDWEGGTTAEPSSTNRFLGPTGIVSSAASATDIRGATGAAGSGSGDVVAANNLSDLVSASSARTNLGLGTIATQAASSVSITGGSITGITDLAIADGGTGASDAATAFSNLKQAASSSATGVLEIATTTEVRSAATGDKALTAQLIEESSAAVTLTDGASIAFDWDAGIYRTLTIAGSRTLSNPTNGQPGTWRYVRVLTSGASRSLTFSSNYKFAGGTDFVISTTTSTVDFFCIFCHTTTEFYVFGANAFA